MISSTDRLLTPNEVAALLGIKTATLKDWRYHARGPAYTRLSKKTVRYWLSAVMDFMVKKSEEIAKGLKKDVSL